MAITDRNLTPGTALFGTYKKQEYFGKTLETGMEITDGPDQPRGKFKSLSAAATAIRGSATNGYLFWTVKGDETESPREAALKTDVANVLDESVESDAIIEAAECQFCGAEMQEGDKVDECSHAEGQGGAAGVLIEEVPAPVGPKGCAHFQKDGLTLCAMPAMKGTDACFNHRAK